MSGNHVLYDRALHPQKVTDEQFQIFYIMREQIRKQNGGHASSEFGIREHELYRMIEKTKLTMKEVKELIGKGLAKC
jgi:hypothetical protein